MGTGKEKGYRSLGGGKGGGRDKEQERRGGAWRRKGKRGMRVFSYWFRFHASTLVLELN